MAEEPTWVELEVVLADSCGPNLNQDAYTQEGLEQLAAAAQHHIDTGMPLPVSLNFGPTLVGQVQQVWFDLDTLQLRARVRVDAPRVEAAFKTHVPVGAMAVHTRYTMCSHCGKQLYSALEAPCPGAHHVVEAAALVADTVSFGLVEHSAFDRPPGEPTVNPILDITSPTEE
jgi:hypothetical protein